MWSWFIKDNAQAYKGVLERASTAYAVLALWLQRRMTKGSFNLGSGPIL